jgi:methylmalonyl-CoA mutase cobalamin-binding subunit
VLKDYRVNAAREFGKAYREADESPLNADKEAPPSKDPDSIGRGLTAHNRTQNVIAEILRKIGIEPLSPGRDEPEYDIAWKIGETFHVCEVKSITALNEERQLRMAVGQVIRYRQKLAACGHEPIQAVVAAERCPNDRSWVDLCEKEGILLIWPEVASNALTNLLPNPH